MNILLISHYYPPEIGAASNRIGFFANYLAARGHHVTVLTAAPSYPDAEIYGGHENRLTIRQENGVAVVRTRVFLNKKKQLAGRLIHYFSFIINGFFARCSIAPPDIIFATSPPLFIGLLAIALKKRWRVPLILDIRDLWPQSVESVSAVGSRSLLNFGSRLARFLYRRADQLTVTSRGIAAQLPEYAEKVSIIPNGADLDLFSRPHAGSSLAASLPVKNKFVVMYTGNVGLAQAPRVLISAAEKLRNEKNILFVIVGSGILLDELKRAAAAASLTNVIFTGPLPRREMPAILSIANLCVIPYKKADTFRATLPSKLFDYMAAGKPVIINLKGEAWDLMSEARCGILAQEENADDLAQKILASAKNPGELESMGRNGRVFVTENYTREAAARTLETLIERHKKSVTGGSDEMRAGNK